MKTTAASAVRVREIPAGESLKPFLDVAWRVNARDPNWVPPLRMSMEGALDRKKHPFHQHAEAAYFVAERSGEVVGRIAAVVNRLHEEHHGEKVGFFGLFESENSPATARALLDAAADWLRARGMPTMRGPINLSTNEEAQSPGILVEGFDRPAVFMTAHNPPWYRDLLEGAGMEKLKDLYAFWMEGPTPPARLLRSVDAILERSGTIVRPLDPKHFRREVDILKEIYNAAWSRNWGFVPMTDAEFEHLAKEFRPIADFDLCLIAETNGIPSGFSLALPDLNQAIRHLPDGRLFPFGLFKFLWHRRKINVLRYLTLGIRPEYQHLGLGNAFYLRTWETGLRKGYYAAEASWVLEDNLPMVRPLERMGAPIYKTWRLYERTL